MSKIAIAGDWHIDTEWAIEMLQKLNALGIKEVQHVGDFGFDSTPRGYAYLDALHSFCEQNKMTINVTAGNHENFPFMNDCFTTLTVDGFLTSPQWSTISVVPRGQRWERESTSFVSLGGANSINRYSLTPNIDWWEEEQISLGDMYRTIQGGTADVMITHDCPISTPFKVSDDSWPAKAVQYAKESQTAIEQVVSSVKPKILFHGHHHVYHDLIVPINDGTSIYNQRVVGLNMNGRDNNIAMFDLVTKEYELL